MPEDIAPGGRSVTSLQMRCFVFGVFLPVALDNWIGPAVPATWTRSSAIPPSPEGPVPTRGWQGLPGPDHPEVLEY
jgi:hypothetical protein